MYNEKIKKQYIAEVGSSQNKADRIFNVYTEYYEDVAGKDLAEFNERGILVMLSKCGAYNLQTIREIMRVGRSYCRWCIERRVFCTYINPFDHIKPEDVNLYNTVSQRFIGSPDIFVNYIRRVHNPSACYADTPVLCFLWLGISFQEMPSIKKSDVRIDERTVYIPESDRIIRRIPQSIADVLSAYASADSITRRVGEKTIRFYEDATPQFIRKMVTARQKINGIPIDRRELSLSVQLFNDDAAALCSNIPVMSQDILEQSGVFWNLYDLQQHGLWIGDAYGEYSICDILGKKDIASCKDQLYLYEIYKNVFHGGN